MKVLIEGPKGSFLWTEIMQDCFRRLGHKCDIYFHNKKNSWARITKRINKLTCLLPGQLQPFKDWSSVSNEKLLKRVSEENWDLLFSIQGKITSDTLERIRHCNPGIKVVYWWGDIMSDAGHRRILELAPHVDQILLSYPGDLSKLKEHALVNLAYFPFGVSQRYHIEALEQALQLQRTIQASDISFVGTYYSNRCQAIHALQTRHKKITVYGRSWRHCNGVNSLGGLSLIDSLLVHHASKISLNLHHFDTCNGLNMKFYEIPAAGGFQICDYQAVMDEFQTGRMTVSFRSLEELAEKTDYYLTHESERLELTRAIQHQVLADELYTTRLQRLLDSLY